MPPALLGQPAVDTLDSDSPAPATADKPARPARYLPTAADVALAPIDGVEMQPNSAREREILVALERFVDADSEFQDQRQGDEARKVTSQPPACDWWSACYALVMSVVAGPCPRRFCGKFLVEAEKLGVALAAHLVDTPMPLSTFPKPALTNARDGMRLALERIAQSERPRADLETFQDLVSQKVPHEQIARMWRLTFPDGLGRKHLVQQEISEPGSVPEFSRPQPDDAKDCEPVAAESSGFLLSVAADRLRRWHEHSGYKLG